jgi:hypothetical protein
VDDLFERLLLLSREAHAARLHEVAYHALTAAMHAAHSRHDESGLAAVEREANAQIAWIDEHAPAHRLSTASAGHHEHPGFYALLARQAATYAEMDRRNSMPTDGGLAPKGPV